MPDVGPLTGLRVLDLSTVFATPYMGALMSDLGADVIKVEAPARLDQTRGDGFGPYLDNAPGPDGWNWSGTFHSLNRGKRSLVLDLKQEAGRDIARALAGQADVLLENFTPRVMRGWRMTYADLAPANPGLIMVSNTGYGATGPWSGFKAQGTALEATMGIVAFCGYTGDKPKKVGQSYPDFLAAWTGLTAIAAALAYRGRSGRGQWIDLGMYQLGPAVIPEALIAAQAGQPIAAPAGNDEAGSLLAGVFACAGQDRWLAVSITGEAAWAAVAALVPGFPSSVEGGREQARAALATWARDRDDTALAAQFQAAGVPAAEVANLRDVLTSDQYAERGFFEWAELRPGDRRPIIGRPYRWTGAGRLQIRGRGPLYGEHNAEVLGQLGLSPPEQEALARAGVVTDHPRGGRSLVPADLEVLRQAGVYSDIDPHYREVIAENRE